MTRQGFDEYLLRADPDKSDTDETHEYGVSRRNEWEQSVN